MTAPTLSLIVVCYEMQRELQRTIRSLSVPYQRDIARSDYEVVLIDNGSRQPPRPEDFAGLDIDLRILHYPDPTPSPVAALNMAVASTSGALVGVMIDGARMASPGMLGAALRASRIEPRTVVGTLNFHIGPDLQWVAQSFGYTRDLEDRLLETARWEEDGYRLFDIGPRADNVKYSWFGPLSETNAIFLPRAMWRELDGYDPAFELPGGGGANADFFKRATELPGSRSVVLLGEGTFHQLHGGVSTNAHDNFMRNYKAQAREYMRIRGRLPARAPRRAEAYGPVSEAALDAFLRAPITATTRTSLPAPATGGDSLYIGFLKSMLLATPRPGSPALSPDDIYLMTLGLQVRPVAHVVPHAFTMIGRKRLDNLSECVATVLNDGIPGDLVECGVWRGGATILMRAMLFERGILDRTVWVADSFAGLPPPDPETDDGFDLSAEKAPVLVVSQPEVEANFAAFGLLDRQVRFLKGWFADTLPTAPIERIAVLRLDGDLYSSTMDALEALYTRVVPGGFIIVDDYLMIAQCARAVDEFRARNNIVEPLQPIDIGGVFWRRAI